MPVIAATLGYYGAIAALIMAIGGREKMRRGVNDYERKKNARAAEWNRIYDCAFWAAFAIATAMFAMEVL